MPRYYEGIPYGPKYRQVEPRRGRSPRPYLALVVVAALLLAAVSYRDSLLNGGDSQPPTPASTAQLPIAAQPTRAPVATATLPPSPTPLPTREPTVLVVANTDRLGVYLRRTPRLEDRVRAWQEGTIMVVIGDDQEVDGRRWRNVRDPAGNEGWIPAQYLVPPGATRTPTATPAARR